MNITVNNLTTNTRGEIKNTQANRRLVQRGEIEAQGIAGFGSNSYYYTDHRLGNTIVRMTRDSIEIIAVRTKDGYVPA